MNGFRGDRLFLSNFHRCRFFVEISPGVYWDAASAEHGYQAWKAGPDSRAAAAQWAQWVLDAPTARLAKVRGRQVPLRAEWSDSMALAVMEVVLWEKFGRGQTGNLHNLLTGTGSEPLVEWNSWHDTFWGRCTCPKHAGAGDNHLGRTLERIRARIVWERTLSEGTARPCRDCAVSLVWKGSTWKEAGIEEAPSPCASGRVLHWPLDEAIPPKLGEVEVTVGEEIEVKVWEDVAVGKDETAMLGVGGQETLNQEQERLRAHLAHGTTCRACGLHAQVYRRTLQSSIVRDLIRLYREWSRRGGNRVNSVWVPVDEVLEIRGGDYGKARFWNLIVQKPKELSGKVGAGITRTSGEWNFTPLGVDFVLGQAQVRKAVWVYDNRVVPGPWDRPDDLHEIDVVEALGRKFHYETLMAGGLD